MERLIISSLIFMLGVFATQILEFYGIKLYDFFFSSYFRRIKNSRQKKLKSNKIYNWLLKYYQNRLSSHYLYEFDLASTLIKIPFLTKDSWVFSISRIPVNLLLTTPPINSPTKINNRLIRKRKNLAYSLWDSPIFYVDSIHEKNESTDLNLGIGSYFQFISSCGKLEEESIACAFSKRRPKYRNKMFGSSESIQQCNFKSQAIGISCIILIGTTYEKMSILIQWRNDTTAIHPSKLATVPAFAFQPLYDAYSIELDLKHQFLREYFEELYNKEELINKGKYLSPTWFYEHEVIVRLLSMESNKKISYHTLGFGFDIYTAEANIAYLIHISDEDFWAQERRRLLLNWEITDIKEIPIFSAELDDFILHNKIAPCSAFGIIEARKYAKKIGI